MSFPPAGAPQSEDRKKAHQKIVMRRIVLMPSAKVTIKSIQKHEEDSNRKVLTQQMDYIQPYDEFAIKSNPDDMYNEKSGLSDQEIICEDKFEAPPILMAKTLVNGLSTLGERPSADTDSKMTNKTYQYPSYLKEHNDRIKGLRGPKFYTSQEDAIQPLSMLLNYENYHQQQSSQVINRTKKIIRLKSRRYENILDTDQKNLKTSRKTKETRSLETRNSKKFARYIQVTLANSPHGHQNFYSHSVLFTPLKSKSEYNSIMLSDAHRTRNPKFNKTLGIKVLSQSNKKPEKKSKVTSGCFLITRATCCPSPGDVDPIESKENTSRSVKRTKPGKPIKTINHIVTRKAKPIKLFRKKSESHTSLR